jgi:transposase-like protein
MKKGLTMSESKRNIFSSTEKAKVTLAAVKGIKTINEIAQEHGVHPTQVNQWKKELLDNVGSLFEGKRGPKPVNAQNDPDRLYAKIGQLNIDVSTLFRTHYYDVATLNRTLSYKITEKT